MYVSILPFMLWYLFFFLIDKYETILPVQRQAWLSSTLP